MKTSETNLEGVTQAKFYYLYFGRMICSKQKTKGKQKQKKKQESGLKF